MAMTDFTNLPGFNDWVGRIALDQAEVFAKWSESAKKSKYPADFIPAGSTPFSVSEGGYTLKGFRTGNGVIHIQEEHYNEEHATF